MKGEFRKGDIITMICGNGNRILVTHTTKSCYYLKSPYYPSCAYRKIGIDRNFVKVGSVREAAKNEE